MTLRPESDAELNAMEEERAEAFYADALLALNPAITSRTVVASVEANRDALSEVSVGGAQEVMRDVLTLDNDLQGALASDLRNAVAKLLALINEAIIAGYTDDLTGRVHLLNQNGDRTYEAEVTERDRRQLLAYPIMGHSHDEIALHETTKLQFAAWSSIASPVTGQSNPRDVPELVEGHNLTFAQDAAGWVRQAYWTGTQAAQLEAGAAVAT